MALSAALIGLATLAGPALGHADLVSADPADGAVLATPPTMITLTFSEGLGKAKSSFKLLAPDGTEAATGKPGEDGAKTMAASGLTLTGAGTWTIRWTAAALDGHIERGKLTFTVEELTPMPATPEPTAVPSAAVASAPPVASAPAPSDPEAAPAASEAPVTPSTAPAGPASSASPVAPASSTSTADIFIPIIAVLVVVGLVAAFVLRRSRRI